jgi:hypothetical protein
MKIHSRHLDILSAENHIEKSTTDSELFICSNSCTFHNNFNFFYLSCKTLGLHIRHHRSQFRYLDPGNDRVTESMRIDECVRSINNTLSIEGPDIALRKIF